MGVTGYHCLNLYIVPINCLHYYGFLSCVFYFYFLGLAYYKTVQAVPRFYAAFDFACVSCVTNNVNTYMLWGSGVGQVWVQKRQCLFKKMTKITIIF